MVMEQNHGAEPTQPWLCDREVAILSKLSALEEARGQAEPFHAGPASPDSHCMSAYEHTRLLNVARNMAELERLGLRAVS